MPTAVSIAGVADVLGGVGPHRSQSVASLDRLFGDRNKKLLVLWL